MASDALDLTEFMASDIPENRGADILVYRDNPTHTPYFPKQSLRCVDSDGVAFRWETLGCSRLAAGESDLL